MRKISFLILILVLLPSVLAQSVQIGLINQDPDPVSAGDVVEVRFKVENLWETTKDEIIVVIMPEYPFTLYSGEKTRNIGILTGRQYGADAQILDFKLKVDKNAVEGDHEIGIKVSTGETIWVYDDLFFVDIESEEIRFRTYIRNSNIIIPGSKGTFSIEFANAGGYDIEFLELELLSSPDYKLLSTSTYTYIGELDSDDTESEEFQIYVPDEIEVVNIPIKVTYEVNDYTYEEESNLQLELLTIEEAKNIGLIKSKNTTNIILAIIAIIVILFIIRKVRKR